MKYIGDHLFFENENIYAIVQREGELVLKKVLMEAEEQETPPVEEPAKEIEPEPKKEKPLCKQCQNNPIRGDDPNGVLCQECFDKLIAYHKRKEEEAKPKKKGLFGRKK